MIKNSASTLLSSLLVLVLANQVANCWWFSSSDEPQQKAQSALATFDMEGVKGQFKFSQASPSEPTLVEYDLTGLQGNNKLYHVHVRPVPPFDANQARKNSTLVAQLCGDPATGGHLNPHHITAKLPPKSAPLDKYEVGDLSGKHGPLAEVPQQADHFKGQFKDDKLPMSGENSIIGRSIVIHKNDGKRWICASIVPVAY